MGCDRLVLLQHSAPFASQRGSSRRESTRINLRATLYCLCCLHCLHLLLALEERAIQQLPVHLLHTQTQSRAFYHTVQRSKPHQDPSQYLSIRTAFPIHRPTSSSNCTRLHHSLCPSLFSQSPYPVSIVCCATPAACLNFLPARQTNISRFGPAFWLHPCHGLLS